MAAAEKDLTISSLRGGVNNSDPAISLPEDQCVLAKNVEWVESMLGERRRGSVAISVSGSDISGKDRVTFLHRHLPTSDETASELWVLGVTGTSSSALCKKTTSWTTITLSEAITLTSGYQYQVAGQTLHGKLFLAYKSSVDRLHVSSNGTTVRKTGFGEPAAPTGADQGAGAIEAVRYYRVRYTEQVGGATTRRSEPSNVLTHDPVAAASVRVTKPATISEGETHWELEASHDNIDFYVIATTAVGTTFYDDSNTNYTTFTLSEDVGGYENIHSGEFLSADEDRLLIGGSFEDDDLASRVSWTPVFNDTGAGNDERIPITTTNFLDLDTFEGGKLTGLSNPVIGSVWATKLSHIYKLVRTTDNTKAYDPVTITKARGALKGSLAAGIDQRGMAALYFLDPQVGPCRIGVNGIQQCGADIRITWKTLNIDATDVVCRAIYYPEARQVHWWIAETGQNKPTLRLVLQVNESRDFADGIRRGWAIWDGNSAKAIAACLYSTNIDAGTARNKVLVPFIGLEGLGLIHRTDTGTDDNGVAYTARIKTKPYWLKSILHKFGVRVGALLAKAVTGASVDLAVYRDFEIETTKTVEDISFTATGTENQVIKFLDNLTGSEMRVAQFEFIDVDSPGDRWELNQLAVVETPGQQA